MDVDSPDSQEDPEQGAAIEDLAVAVPLAAIPLLAVAFVALVWAGFGNDRVLVSLVPFVVLLAAITVIDLRELRIPDKLTRPAALVAVPLLLVAASSSWPDLSIGRALLGGLAYGAFYFVVWFVYPAGMGFGDVKLAPIIGAQLGLFGWVPLVRSLVFAQLAGGVVAIVILVSGLIVHRRLRRNAAFPHGPFMVIGAIAALALEAFG